MKFFNWIKAKKPIIKTEFIALSDREQHHDLDAIYQELNQRYFGGKIDIPIVWFGDRVPRARKRVLLGSYHLNKKTIKINRLLDRPFIPRFYVSFIVYHEMLHHVFPPIVTKAKRKIHHPKFKMAEKRFEDYVLANQFGKDNKKLWFR